LSSLDLGRGCAYQCSFCAIINVQGRKSRFRTPDDLEQAIRENYRQGNRRCFITDDNFARNRHWEPLFDRMIELRVGEGLKIGFTIQVDRLCHRIRLGLDDTAAGDAFGHLPHEDLADEITSERDRIDRQLRTRER
jgi:hypothetical protein